MSNIFVFKQTANSSSWSLGMSGKKETNIFPAILPFHIPYPHPICFLKHDEAWSQTLLVRCRAAHHYFTQHPTFSRQRKNAPEHQFLNYAVAEGEIITLHLLEAKTFVNKIKAYTRNATYATFNAPLSTGKEPVIQKSTGQSLSSIKYAKIIAIFERKRLTPVRFS